MSRLLVTGGLGFIGFNAVLRASAQGRSVVVLDNLKRRTARRNLKAYRKLAPRGAKLVVADVRDAGAVARVFKRHGPFDGVIHLAGQVAVTTSVAEPVRDFEANALGTLNVLEAIRKHSKKSRLVFASTNKVYGGLDWTKIARKGERYVFRHPAGGVSEAAPLDFHSPYGCSKGAADQYVRDYARIYGLGTVVFRQSCIYGPWQYGEEDQGWVAWFLIAALRGAKIRLFGDGRQVRDVLFIDDLLELYDRGLAHPAARGEVFNVGGGPSRTLSLLELLGWIRERLGIRPPLERHGWRPGDQRVYISDISKAGRRLGWKPKTSVDAGLSRLADWLKSGRIDFA
ncbi:MAG: GDP-mannose 4,6-dehydratase [Elusimicrobia bacterium]|nr:GDP-mannose 4,6-dehydratase [Elusimicrobiota bacterium]